MNVYLVFDKDSDINVSLHQTIAGARIALVDYLENIPSADWERIANDYSYGTVDEFKEAVLTMDDYDEDFGMSIITIPLQD